MPTVRFATIAADREAAFRFRYDVYHDEMQLDGPAMDHDRRVLTDADDEQARILVAHDDDGRLVGTLRIHWGGDGPFSNGLREIYGLDPFAEVTSPDELVVFDRFMVDAAHRGTFLPLQFLAEISTFSLERRARLTFCDCQPHLLNFYTSLGFRTHTRTVNDPMMGLLVPLVFVVEDRAHLEAIGSPMLGLEVGTDYDPAPPTDILALLPEAAAIEAVDADGAAQWAVDRGLLGGAAAASALDGLDQDEVRELLARAFVLRVEQGDRLIRRDATDRTMFIVLDGSVEVRDEGRHIATLGPGEVFGELAFLLHGDRSTDVVAATDGVRVLSLNEKVVLGLQEERPELAARFFLNLARVVSAKLVAVQRASRTT